MKNGDKMEKEREDRIFDFEFEQFHAAHGYRDEHGNVDSRELENAKKFAKWGWNRSRDGVLGQFPKTPNSPTQIGTLPTTAWYTTGEVIYGNYVVKPNGILWAWVDHPNHRRYQPDEIRDLTTQGQPKKNEENINKD